MRQGQDGSEEGERSDGQEVNDEGEGAFSSASVWVFPRLLQTPPQPTAHKRLKDGGATS